MKIGAFMHGRMGSSRMPGKSMAPICGYPSGWHCYQRLKSVYPVDEVWFMPTERDVDRPIMKLAEYLGEPYVIREGNGEDIASAEIEIHRNVQADVYLVLGMDSPLGYVEYGKMWLQAYLDGAAYVPTLPLSKMPPWFYQAGSVAVIPGWGIDLYSQYPQFVEREYSSEILRRHPELWPKSGVVEIDLPTSVWSFGNHRITLDEYPDWGVISEIYHALWHGPGHIIDAPEALAYLDKHPELSACNNWVGESAKAQEVRLWSHRNEAMQKGYALRFCECEGYIGYVKDWQFVPWGDRCLKCGRIIE
jgi:spore coat polysaccharide biosynthesis protein SpsF